LTSQVYINYLKSQARTKKSNKPKTKYRPPTRLTASRTNEKTTHKQGKTWLMTNSNKAVIIYFVRLKI